jgi:hypothetical protein
MTKLSETSETSIAIPLLVVNLSTLLRQVLLFLFVRNQKSYCFRSFLSVILILIDNYQQNHLSLKKQNLPLAS